MVCTTDDFIKEGYSKKTELAKKLSDLLPDDIRETAEIMVQLQRRSTQRLAFSSPQKVELIAIVLALRRAYGGSTDVA